MIDEQYLIRQLKAGNQSAPETVLDRYGSYVRAIASNIIRPPMQEADVEDNRDTLQVTEVSLSREGAQEHYVLLFDPENGFLITVAGTIYVFPFTSGPVRQKGALFAAALPPVPLF